MHQLITAPLAALPHRVDDMRNTSRMSTLGGALHRKCSVLLELENPTVHRSSRMRRLSKMPDVSTLHIEASPPIHLPLVFTGASLGRASPVLLALYYLGRLGFNAERTCVF